MAQSNPRLVVVGSIGLDTIETPRARREEILGGSAVYACAAASFFTRVGMVGVVGTDFPLRHRRLFERFGIDLRGLQTVEGRTFRWSGVYEEDFNSRRTLKTELNVFADFEPRLPPAYRRAPFLFLANIAPALQLHILDQMERRPRLVLADTMDLWIHMARTDLHRLIARVDVLTLNDSEARHLTGRHSLVAAAHAILRLGPRAVLVKKGEHGCLLFTPHGIRVLPAFPLEEVYDPTGAGDAFAGGLSGWLASRPRYSLPDVRAAMVHGSVIASFGVEAFGLDRLRRLTRPQIEARVREFRAMCRV